MAKQKKQNNTPTVNNKKNSVINRLLNFFNIAQKGDKNEKELAPGKPNEKKSDLKPTPLNFPSDIQKYYEYWISNMDTLDSLNDRMTRYKDLEFMVLNSGIMSRAASLYADETIFPDEQDEIIHIKAKDKKVEKYIKEFFNRIGITKSVLEECAWDLSVYSDHFWVRSSNYKDGITEITPVDVYQIEERIEFSAIRSAKAFNKNSYLSKLVSRDERMKVLYDLLKQVKEGEDYSSFFKNYLFGFSISDSKITLPPWNVSHFRRFTAKSEFAPYGRPVFIHSIAPYRMFKAAQNLVEMLRASKIPKEKYSVAYANTMTEADTWEKVNETKEEFLNTVNLQNGQEDLGVGGQIWTIKDLLDYELIENRTNLNDVFDLSVLLDDLITSTAIPPGYLIQTDRGLFGNSGQALMQQSKPFARQVYRNQSAIIDELIDLVKTQFVMLGLFDQEKTEFEISLNFPSVEESSDRLRIKSDSFRLANDILSNISSALGLDRGESLPQEIVQDIFTKYSFIEPLDLKTWFDTFKKAKELEQSENDIMEASQKIKDRLTEDLFREAYFSSKKRLNLLEGVENGRHYQTSFQNTPERTLIYECLKHNKKSKKIEG